MITLISQKVVETKYRKVDSLEHTYLKYFGNLGFSLVPVPNSGKNLDFYFNLPVSRIILTGGGDLGKEYTKERDKTERALLNFAIERDIPVLGICRGMQQINDYFGGHLSKIKNVSKENHVAMDHPVRIINKELEGLIGKKIKVNSYHNYGVTEKDVSSELSVFAKSPEGIIEGIYHPSLPIAGMEWHPERKSPNKEVNEEIINSFLKGELFWKK